MLKIVLVLVMLLLLQVGVVALETLTVEVEQVNPSNDLEIQNLQTELDQTKVESPTSTPLDE